jgi:hypothetical protein
MPVAEPSFLAESHEVGVGQNLRPNAVSLQVSLPSTRGSQPIHCHCIGSA